jgi:hypothetical protein
MRRRDLAGLLLEIGYGFHSRIYATRGATRPAARPLSRRACFLWNGERTVTRLLKRRYLIAGRWGIGFSSAGDPEISRNARIATKGDQTNVLRHPTSQLQTLHRSHAEAYAGHRSGKSARRVRRRWGRSRAWLQARNQHASIFFRGRLMRAPKTANSRHQVRLGKSWKPSWRRFSVTRICRKPTS